LLSGNYQGLQFFDFTKDRFNPGKSFSPFEESSRYLVIDAEKNIWVSHPYHGVFRILHEKNYSQPRWKTYGVNDGLPSQLNNHVFKILEQLVVGTEKGVYRYNSTTDRFEADTTYSHWLGDQSIRYLQEDIKGNIWFIHEKSVGWIDRSSTKASVTYLPELKKKILSGFEFIYPFNDENIFLAGESGLYHVNLSKYRKQREKLEVGIRGVRLGLQADSLLYGGFGKIEENSRLKIGPEERNIRFEYSAAPITDPESIEYSYRLNGFQNKWSEWTKRTEKEFTNLPAGNYLFEVKARNNLGNESTAVSFPFVLASPWYQTKAAWLFYFLVIAGILFWRYRFLQNKFRQQQQQFDDEQRKLQYILELEKNRAENELISVKSQTLETEIQFKNSELASAAMHLVKKGELISKLKSDLNQLIRRVDVPTAQTEVKKMIKQLEEDDQIDQEWDQFAKHFDKVHSDFVLLLKEKHPDISPNEVKLCSFLRMNLSSKEIAQLLNITVRGVEISRYRLRKKLNLQGGENLFDYLIQLQKG
jgi:DNA-binding CsgD family transcriptional regulator